MAGDLLEPRETVQDVAPRRLRLHRAVLPDPPDVARGELTMADQTRDDEAVAEAEGFDRTPWEPWTPKVGDRVQIHMSAECRHRWEPGHGQGHFREFDGLVGRVWAIRRQQEPTHPYLVELDASVPHPETGETVFGMDMAACELIPLGEAR